MLSLNSCVKIIIVALMLACALILFSILLVSSFSDWTVVLSTNLFGEGHYELVLFFVISVLGIVFLFHYIKKMYEEKGLAYQASGKAP